MYEYMIGYTHGWYEKEIAKETSYSKLFPGGSADPTLHKRFYTYDKRTQEYKLGLEDGRADRDRDGRTIKSGDFFSFNLSGYPWGSKLERRIENKFVIDWLDENGDLIKRPRSAASRVYLYKIGESL